MLVTLTAFWIAVPVLQGPVLHLGQTLMRDLILGLLLQNENGPEWFPVRVLARLHLCRGKDEGAVALTMEKEEIKVERTKKEKLTKKRELMTNWRNWKIHSAQAMEFGTPGKSFQIFDYLQPSRQSVKYYFDDKGDKSHVKYGKNDPKNIPKYYKFRNLVCNISNVLVLMCISV